MIASSWIFAGESARNIALRRFQSKAAIGKRRLVLSLVAALALAAPAFAQGTAAPVVTGNARVDKLLSQMTLEEKIGLIHGTGEDPATSQGEAGYMAGLPRLGIPALRLSDGPPGVLTRLPSQAETATMGVAATFSTEDARQNGIVIAREARSLGIDIVLEPFINMDRDITFSRGYNTFGEDPVLTGAMGAAEIEGIQSLGILAQAKHYVAYDTAGTSVVVDPQTLHEIYVAPFKDAVDAGVSSVMCAYEYLNGARSCGNTEALQSILRGELGFKGFVTSDWGATHAPTFVNNGLDLEMPGTPLKGTPAGGRFSFFNYEPIAAAPAAASGAAAPNMAPPAASGMPEEPAAARGGGGGSNAGDPRINLWDALHSGAVKEDAITRAAGWVLLAYEKFGLLDHAPQHAILAHDEQANAGIIRKTAEDSAVLMKNEGGVLPLRADALASLAMIGPGAGQVVAIGNNSERSLGFPWQQVSPIEALKKSLPAGVKADIRFAVADNMSGTPIPASAFTHDGQPGLVRTSTSGSTQVDADVDFTTASKKPLPARTTASWTGNLIVPSEGLYEIDVQMLGAVASLKIDGKAFSGIQAGMGNSRADSIQASQSSMMPTPDGLNNVRKQATLTAGAHAIELTVSADKSGGPEQIRLSWSSEADRKRDREDAIQAAKAAETAVVFAWSRGNPTFSLPGDQDKLIDDIAAANPNTVVVLNVSQPIAMPWLNKVKGVLLMWWPGDEGGAATANILLGKTSPAGRLPFTWARSLAEYCCAANPAYPERTAAGVDGKTTYSEGIFVGYRWFDKEKIEPLFPFGYGLSYSKFDYSGLKIAHAADGGLDVSFNVKNSGTVASDEAPQVYLGPPANPPAGASFAVRSLVGFTRVHIDAGKQQTITIHLAKHRLEYWSAATSKWEIAKGARTLLVGRSSRDLPLQGSF